VPVLKSMGAKRFGGSEDQAPHGILPRAHGLLDQNVPAAT